MDEMQQTILSMCNDIANVNNWDVTVNFDVNTLRVDFTCDGTMQKNCYLKVNYGTPNFLYGYDKLLITTIFSNLLDLRFGTIVNVPNGDLTKEKLS